MTSGRAAGGQCEKMRRGSERNRVALSKRSAPVHHAVVTNRALQFHR